MTEYDLGKVVGDDGEAGNGIASITKTGTSGLVDTYTITYDDGTTTTFTVTNGSDASVTIQTSWGSTTSDSKVPSEKLTKDTLDTKIAKSSTTGLVKNDGTIMTSGTGSTNYSAGNHTHSSYVSGSKVTSWSSTVSDSNIPSEKLVKNSLDDKISKSSTSGLVKNDGTIDTSSYLTTGTASSTYQPKLTSGTNIKTINNESLLGSGNITIQGGSSVDVVTSWEATLSDSKVPSEKLVKNTIDGLSIPTKTSDLTNDGDGTNVFVKNNDSRLTDARTPTSHTHGNLTNDGKVGSNANYIVVTGTGGAITSVQKLGNITYDGKIGSTSGKPVITTTSGTVTTGSFGTSSGTFAEGNHTHSGYISTSSTTGLIKNDGSIMTSGTGSSNWAVGNHSHSGYVSATKVTSWSGTVSDSNVPSEKLVKNSLDDKIGKSSTSGLVKNDGTIDTSSYLTTGSASSTYQTKLVSGTSIKTINNESLLGSGNITIQGGSGSPTGDYFFSLNSFFDPNQWTGSPTISNGVITLSSDAYFPLRLPPNCTLSFDISVTSGYDEQIRILDYTDISWMYYPDTVLDFSFTCSNNNCLFLSDASSDEFSISNVASRYGLTIPITNGTTATISNVKYKDNNTKELYDLIGNAIIYINGRGS